MTAWFVSEYGLIVLALVAAAIGAVWARYNWLLGKAVAAKEMVERLGYETRSAFFEVIQVYDIEAKKGKADGTWTETEQKNAKAAAITKAKENLGWKGVRRAMRVLGFDEALLDKYIGGKVEALIGETKLATKVPSLPPR